MHYCIQNNYETLFKEHILEHWQQAVEDGVLEDWLSPLYSCIMLNVAREWVLDYIPVRDWLKIDGRLLIYGQKFPVLHYIHKKRVNSKLTQDCITWCATGQIWDCEVLKQLIVLDIITVDDLTSRKDDLINYDFNMDTLTQSMRSKRRRY